MRRIYLEIYLSVVGTALLATIGLSIFGQWHFEGRLEADHERLREVGRLVLAELPAEASDESLRSDLERLAGERHISAVLWDAEGRVLATGGPGVRPGLHAGRSATPVTERSSEARRFEGRDGNGHRGHHRGPSPWAWTSVPTPDGGLLELASTEQRGPTRHGPWLFLAAFLGTIAVAAYPVSRRITRGLERLREGVSELGEGDLGARVEIEGHNEVADVARAFNAAAEKIQRAVEAQKRVLASASHELRSPLGRLRAALELLAEGRSEHLPEAERDIAELDALIEDLLLAARLETTEPVREPVDLLAIAREEAERVGAAVSGEASGLLGDARMLRRMLSNLLGNALRHGAPPIEVRLETDAGAGTVTLRVSDSGGGVPPGERERIFEPFYRPAGHSEARDGGVGLGLALVAEIATHHGGVARCDADEALGSVFVVELPIG